MNDITININGGNNQILPNATEAVQNFYGDQYAEKILGTSTPDSSSNPELGKLSIYIDKVNLPGYISQIGECLNATEFARTVISIFEQESRLTEEEIVKERFIRLLLPFATKLAKGRTIDTLRDPINDPLLSRPQPFCLKKSTSIANRKKKYFVIYIILMWHLYYFKSPSILYYFFVKLQPMN